MAALSVCLFGRFCVRRGEHQLPVLESGKVRELFCLLVLSRDRSYPREALASILWGDYPTDQSRKYLRQVLWQLQAALDPHTELADNRTLLVESDWVRLNSRAELWIDVALFEQAFALVQDIPGRELDARNAGPLREAVQLYQGDLLEGWYQEWCLFERERLQNLYLAMLDKLMAYCQAHGEYESGLDYGVRILRCDRAHERTHRRMMRLHHLAGNRTAALRQYERCFAALDEELGVRPARRTIALYEQIRADVLDQSTSRPADAIGVPAATPASLHGVLGHLRQLQTALANVQQQVEQHVHSVEQVLNGLR